MTNTPSCKPIQDKLTRGLALADTETSHLGACDACGAVAAEQRAVSRSLEMVAVATPPIGTAERAFRAAMAGESRLARPSFLERLLPIATPFAAGAVAAAALALLVGSPSQPPIASDDGGSDDVVATSLLTDEIDDGVEQDFGADALLALGDDS